MKSSAKNIVLKSVDDIFQTEENRADAQRERVQEIPLDQLKPFKNHPFKVRDDQRMLDTVDSIREYGVLVPAIARPDPEGGYASLGKIWTAQTIRSMLRNVIYTGRMHMNDTVSAPNEALRIISDEDLEFAKYALSARIPRKYHSQRKAEDEALPEDAQTKTSVYGATLLSGLLYCAHCGHKLVGGYCTKQRSNRA